MSRLITGLMQVVEQRRSWTLIVQVVKGLCDLFWGWMTPDFMMRQYRWKLLLSLLVACGGSLVVSLRIHGNCHPESSKKHQLVIISNLNIVFLALVNFIFISQSCCSVETGLAFHSWKHFIFIRKASSVFIYILNMECLHSNCESVFSTQLINDVLQHTNPYTSNSLHSCQVFFCNLDLFALP